MAQRVSRERSLRSVPAPRLAVDEAVPVVTLDARDKLSVRDALLAVLHHTVRRVRTQQTSNAT
jgi:hypothetical protein